METNPQLLAMAKLLQAESAARGDPVFAPQQLAAALAPATVNPNLAAQGARIRAQQATRPVVQDPQWLREGLPMEGRATFLPFQDTAPGSVMNQRSLALPGVLAGAVNAFTAPGRAYSGSDPSFDPQYEAANLAMNMMGGGVGASSVRPQPRGTLGMNVWHGSPHKFDKFDASKIGTGEGAQAYGHGLYFAEAQAAAKEYAKKSGALYKVDLPDEVIAKMLDWNKPLKEQSRHVRDFFSPVNNNKLVSRDFANWMDVHGFNMREMPVSEIHLKLIDWLQMKGMTKEAAQRHISARMASGDGIPYQSIPGIRHQNEASSGAGTGTSNFVVFPGNEGILKILERQ